MGSKAQDPNEAAMELQEQQLERLSQIDLPELEEYSLENPELVGLLEAASIDPSAMEDIQLDQGLKENQLQALEALKERAESGLTASDKFEMEQLLGDVNAAERSQRASIDEQMQRQGMGSSGASLISKLSNQQNQANNAREKTMQMAAQAQQNKMNALSQLSSQSGQMQAQDFSQQAQTASAKDVISKANAMNRQNVNAQNLAARQGIENQRVNISNMNNQVGNQISQQNFSNQITKATGQGGVANNMANIAANAPQKPGMMQGALGGAATGASVGGPWGAVIGAGVGALSTQMEDGGVARRYQDGGSPSEEMMVVSEGSGEIVDSGRGSYAGDRVDAKLNDGEAVLNIPQQQRFMDLVRGKISVDELGDDDIIEGVPRDYRDSLHDRIEGKSDSKMEGLEKLLEMLGK